MSTGYSKTFSVIALIVAATFSFGPQSASAISIPYDGTVTMTDGTVGVLLGDLPIPALGKGIFDDGTNALDSINFNVGAFFFSSLWTGACTTPMATDCMTTDPDQPLGTTFVPIDGIVSNTLTFGPTGVSGGALVFSTFSVTFGIPLGDVTLDQDAGTFQLIGSLGNASGTGAFAAIPVPAVAYLFPAGLIAGLGWMRRRTGA